MLGIKQTATATAKTSSPATVPLRTRPIVLLLGMIAVAIALRVAFLGKSLWLDEGVAVANAWAGGTFLDWLRTLWRGEFNMVFYFALLREWLKLGTGEIFIRLLSVIPAVLTLPFLYAIGSRILDRRVGLIAALLLTVHGAHVLYSQEARGYTLVVFLCTVSTYLFLVGIEKKSRKIWLLYAIVSILAIYTHFFAGLVLAGQWISLAWAPRRSLPLGQIAASAIAVVAAAVPAVYFALTNPGSQVNWIPDPSLGQLVNVISEMAGSPAALPVYLFLWGVALHRRIRKSAHSVSAEGPQHAELSRWHWSLIVSWAAVPILLALLLSLKRPMLVPRYLMVAAPGFILLAAVGAIELSRRHRQIALTLAVLLSIAFVAIRYTRPKEDWRGAGHYVMTQAKPGDAVVVLPWWAKDPFDYYEHRWQTVTGSRSAGLQPGGRSAGLQPSGRSAGLQPGGSHTVPTEIGAAEVTNPANLHEIAARFRDLWVVVYARPQGLTDRQTVEAETNLKQSYRLVEKRNFHLVNVEYYVKR